MLVLVSTPIGNLQDISQRALDMLSSADYLLCEDTRHSRRLLDRYEISNDLRSFHQFNEAEREASILEDLRQEKTIALISDAGTPGISDPGERLVQACIEADIPVTAIPGPTALIHALVCSGLNTERFQFLGFAPRKTGELRLAFSEALSYPGTSIFYESPKRLAKSLALLAKLRAESRCVVARELTKLHETFHRGSAAELQHFFEEQPARGECVLLIEGGYQESSDLNLSEHVALLEEQGLSRNEAIKAAAKQRGIPKRDVYQEIHKL